MVPLRSMLAFAGVAAIIVAIPGPSVLFTVVKLAGAVYIVFLGIQAIRHRRSLSEAVGVLDGIWALAAGSLSQWLSRSPRRLAAIGGVGGLVMIGIGVSVAATGRRN